MTSSNFHLSAAFLTLSLATGCGLNSNAPAPIVATAVPPASGLASGLPTQLQGQPLTSNPSLQAPQNAQGIASDLRAVSGRFGSQLAFFVRTPEGQEQWVYENFLIQLTPGATSVTLQLQSQGQGAWQFQGTLIQQTSVTSGNLRWLVMATVPQASREFGLASVSLLLAVPASTDASGRSVLDWAQAALELRDCESSQGCGQPIQAVQFAPGLQVQ